MTVDPSVALHRLVRKPPGGGGGHTPGVGWMCTSCTWRLSYDVSETRALHVWGNDWRHADSSAAADTLREDLRGRLDQLWGWAKAGKRADIDGGEYYLMDVENVDTFTRDVLQLFDRYADAREADVRKCIFDAIEAIRPGRPVTDPYLQALDAAYAEAARIALGQP